PSKLFAWIATKQDTGWRAKATSASLAQASLKLLRTQSTTLCFSGGKAQRIDIPAAARRLKVWLESGSSYNFTSISTAMNSDQSLRAAMAKRTPPVVRVDPAIIAREHRTTFRLSSPATGLAFGEPDDRLQRVIQYSRDVRARRRGRGVLDRPVKPGATFGVATLVSIPPRPCQLVGMEIGIAEQFLADAGAFHEKADVELVGHAHAAMHLHALLHRAGRGRAGARFRHRNGGGGVFKIAVQFLQRVEHSGAGDLDIDIELGGAVLERLEFADSLAELLSFLQIIHRASEHLFAQADHFGRDRAAPDIEDAFEQRKALIDFAEHMIGGDFDIVELDPRGIVRVDHDGALGRNALGFGIDQEQRDAVALTGLACGARSDDQE